MIPLKINNKHLCKIMDPSISISGWTDQQIIDYSIENKMFPTSVENTSETYSRNADRTANYELEELTLVNAKSKPEFTWSLIRTDYVSNLLAACGFTYSYKNVDGIIVPITSTPITVCYMDFSGMRTISAYLGQTISGTLVEYDGELYWQDFRIAFPER